MVQERFNLVKDGVDAIYIVETDGIDWIEESRRGSIGI